MEIRKIEDVKNGGDAAQAALTRTLIQASEAYYNGNARMSDIFFDQEVERLKKMEEESGFVFEGSPTTFVGASSVTELKEVVHAHAALSLDKVKYKDRNDLIKWLKDGKDDAVLSWKNDGLTVCATYEDGKLVQAVTRGNGIVGSDVTHNAIYFKGLPGKIAYKDHLEVRGEAVMSTAEFERVNALAGGKYENPRNLASATIQMLDANESKKREIRFIAFELVAPDTDTIIGDDSNGVVNIDFNLRFQHERLGWLKSLGFNVVENEKVNSTNILDRIEVWKAGLEKLDYPTDGLVVSYDDMEYGMSLGATEHHFRHSIALKWPDERVETTIRDIRWTIGKTGVITPTAVFDTVRLGLGSDVERAQLHNLSYMKNIPWTDEEENPEIRGKIMIGSKAKVYLANMIIPQVASIVNAEGDIEVEIPTVCPVCGEPTKIENNDGVESLYCTNTSCPGRQVESLFNTFSKDGLNVKGLGKSQIEDLMEAGMVNATPFSFYDMARAYREFEANPNKNLSEPGYLELEKLLAKNGWGQKKWNNLIDAIDASRKVTLQKFLYSLNIPDLGNDLSKKLNKLWNGDVKAFIAFVENVSQYAFERVEDIKAAHPDEEKVNEIYRSSEGYKILTAIDGVGDVKALSVVKWADEVSAYREVWDDFMGLVNALEFPQVDEKTSSDSSLEGLTFVITGKVFDYKNRDEFQASVEARGGKVAGSVSAKTSFLVNNDVTSTSGKNAKAKELNIPIISEAEFIERFGR